MSTEYLQSELTTGLETIPHLEAEPPSLAVRWVNWDSGFRGSDIKPGDQIVAVNGKRVETPANAEDVSKILPGLVGQYAESQTWAALNLKDGAALTLTVRRRNVPGVGRKELEVQGQILAKRAWRDDANEPIFGPGGPGLMVTEEGFNSSWTSWYDDAFIRQLADILDSAPEGPGLTTRYELQRLLERKAAVEFLAAHYSGPFAKAVQADYAAALAIVSGKKREISPADLEYRREEDERIRTVAASGHAAWDAFVAAHAESTVPTFPAIDPISGDRSSVAGKAVVLPPFGNSNWISEADHTYFTFGNQNDGWYIADAEAPAAQQMLDAAERYRKFVSPSLPSEFAVIGRILPNPRLVVVDGRGEFGLQVEVMAAMAGDAMFIDISGGATGEVLFTGEEQFRHAAGAMPANSASPADVMTALIAAIKHGDQPLWKSLFTAWYVSYLDDGRAVLQPYEDRSQDEYWEESRRSILGRVYAAAPVWSSDPKPVMTGKEFPGAPFIEETDVEIEHIGLFDGEYRTFCDVTVNRLWQLQRRDGGPWRISSVQNL
jgi:hypothetical protein